MTKNNQQCLKILEKIKQLDKEQRYGKILIDAVIEYYGYNKSGFKPTEVLYGLTDEDFTHVLKEYLIFQKKRKAILDFK